MLDDPVSRAAAGGFPAGEMWLPPDSAFEDAYHNISALGIDGISSELAQKFVRLCANNPQSMLLSKKKTKFVTKWRRPPLTRQEIKRMQRSVLLAYRRFLLPELL